MTTSDKRNESEGRTFMVGDHPILGEINFQNFTKLMEDVGILKSAKEAANEGSFSEADYPILERGNLLRLHQVIEDVSILKVSAEATAIKFGGLGLRNLQECSRWVELNFSDMKYGLVIDPLVLLDRICGGVEKDPMSQLKTLEARKKLNIDTGAEASSVTSLGHWRPRLFHEGMPLMTCDQNTSRLNQLCKHTKWKTGGEGVRNHIIKRMNVLQQAISIDILYVFENREEFAKAQMLATMSLTASVAFITQLLIYVDARFEKLHVFSKFTVETVWALTMQILDRIIGDLFVPKEGVQNGMRGDRESICYHLVWASLRTLDIAQTYVDDSFENHPAVSSEFIKFLAINSGFEKVEKLGDQLDLMKSKLLAAIEEVKRSGTKADTAPTKCAEAVRDLAALTRRVKTLEDRRGA